MGFMDKAKKMAEQAQEKLDDVQKQFNESPGARGATPPPDAPITEYDKHGRPVGETPASTPPVQPAPPKPPSGELAPTAEKDDEYAPPKMSSGDPLAG